MGGENSEKETALKKLKDEINEFTRQHLPKDDRFFGKVKSKVINDGVWRTVRLKDTEVALIDTPLAQRLRYIHQTGFAHFTYPSMNHSRFEHTLGVILNVEKLGSAIVSHEKQRRTSGNEQINNDDINEMRIAALCHDFGHGVFSHTSETIYRHLPAMQYLMEDFEGTKPHELLSYLILKSKAFEEFLAKIQERELGARIKLDRIAAAIIGDYTQFDQSEICIAELINGPFDADKLDYLFRDSHFSGLPLSIDTERLWHTVRIGKLNHKGSPNNRLMVTINGANCLEQIIQAKMALFASVYQHHKIRAYDCMAFGIFEYMRQNAIPITVRGRKSDWTSPVDFLWICDDDLRGIAFDYPEDDPFHKITHDLYYRRPLKRAVVIAKKTIEAKKEDLVRFIALNHDTIENHIKKRELAQKILQAAGVPCHIAQVWLDIPIIPKTAGAAETYVLTSDNAPDEFNALEDLFPMVQWMTQYSDHKWRGHVFAPCEYVAEIGKAAYEVIRDDYNVKLNKKAFLWCKQKHPYPSDVIG